MHPNTTKPTETLVQGPMGWMGCAGCEKLQRDFVAQTFALIAPVQYVLQQVSCSYGTIQNTPKYYETHRTHWYRVQCGGLVVFVAKNLDETSWHELLQ